MSSVSMSDVSGAADVTGGMPSAAPPSIIPESFAGDLVAAWAELSNVHRSKTANAGTYCLDPATPVLTADLQWVAVGDLVEGDRLAAFEEDPPGPQRARRWRSSIVEAVASVRLPGYRIVLEDGTEFIASANHRWLQRSVKNIRAHWCDTSDLQSSSGLLRVTRRWEHREDWATGYLAAAFDGEGSLCQTVMPPKGSGSELFQSHLAFSQRENVMMEMVDKLAGTMGFVLGDYGKPGSDVRTRRVSGGRAEMLRFLGTIRPMRLLSKLDIDRMGDMRTVELVRVAELEFLGDCDLVATQTSTRTLIADGFATHNSYAYADLGDLLDVARPILAAHNLALIQPLMRMDSAVITVETMLIHSSGHYLSWFFDVSAGATAQATGSGITYARRYSALGALGVAAGGDDDDGAKASAAPHVLESFDDARPVDGPSTVQTKRVVHLFDQLDIVLQKERREVMAAILDAPERTWAELRPDERLTVIEALAERLEEQQRQTADVA